MVEIVELNHFARAIPIYYIMYKESQSPVFSQTDGAYKKRSELLIRFLFLHRIIVSPERRCSSRTFRYGYLVTT